MALQRSPSRNTLPPLVQLTLATSRLFPQKRICGICNPLIVDLTGQGNHETER